MQYKKKAWLITDGKAGSISQVIALAEALNLDYELKLCRSPWFINILHPGIFWFLGKYLEKNSCKISPPYPDYVIASGRRARIFPIYIQKKSPQTKTIYILDPRINPKFYDCVIAPNHDHIKGKNVIKTDLALTRITKKFLQSEKQEFKKTYGKLKSKIATIIVGGNTKEYKLSLSEVEKIVHDIANISSKYDNILISTSRRTPTDLINLLEKEFFNKKNVYIYNPSNPASKNPYYAMLAYADEIFVTIDSISMISEALETKKPVKIINFPNFKGKGKKFVSNLISKGIVSFYDQNLSTASYNPLADTKTYVIKEMKKLRLF